MLSIVQLEEVRGTPKAKLELPQAQIGDPIALRFRIQRKTNGRTEVLDVDGQFRVTARGLDASSGPQRQLLSVEPIGAAPKWRSVKNDSQAPRRLSPARSPRTPI